VGKSWGDNSSPTLPEVPYEIVYVVVAQHAISVLRFIGSFEPKVDSGRRCGGSGRVCGTMLR